MNKILQIILIVVGVLVLAGGLLFAGTFLGLQLNRQAASSAPAVAPGANGQNQAQPQAPNQDNPRGYGGGMMNRGGRGGNGGGNAGPGAGPNGMMFGNNADQANLTPVTVVEAKTAAQAYLTKLNITGLEVGDVTIIDNSAYVVVKESTGGNGAFELLVDPRSKTAHPAGGVSMMWNLKYGGVLQASLPAVGRGPMMGGANNSNVTPTPAATSAAPAATPAAAATPANVSADMPLSAAQAVTAAQSFLDKTFAGATASATPVKFYGYYSLSYSKDGQVVGILSINGFNGQVMQGMLLHGMGMFGQGRP
jgi:hypothetical protein